MTEPTAGAQIQSSRKPTDLAQFYGKSGKPVPLNADGSISCRNCGHRITFPIPPLDELPDGAPRTVNHTGCAKSKATESPAGADAFSGFHETINVIDQNEVAAFAKDPVAFAKTHAQ
jgi:hypothetical protein